MGLEGIWTNEYGSTAELRTSGTTVVGTYRSHTGATGSYPVVGFAAEGVPTAERGLAVCLAISWHSLDHGAPDPSWSWCSVLGGQVALSDGVPKLILQHCMIAGTPADGLCHRGIHLDKLTYRRTDGKAARGGEPARGGPGPAPGTEVWADGRGVALRLVIERRPGAGFDDVRGTLESPGRSLAIVGVGATGHGGGERNRSLALTAFDPVTGRASAWAGLFREDASRTVLLRLDSRGTPSDETYVQTTLEGSEFSRL